MELSPEALEFRRKKCAAYQREWRKKNPEKYKTTIARYWEKKAREAREAEEKANENK